MNDQLPVRCRLLNFVNRNARNSGNPLNVSKEEEWFSDPRALAQISALPFFAP